MTANHGVRLAGQSCISVQNLFVHRSTVDEFIRLQTAVMKAMKVGDPMDPVTDIGPVIDERSAVRIESWIGEASDAGARVLCGGTRRGTLIEPTLITDVSPTMKVVCQEIFGPVIVVRPFDELHEPIAWINQSGFGLNCGIFTASLDTAFTALRKIECGGVIINGSSTFRPDQIPYGGIKQSGLGREGPRYAVMEMTEQKLVVFNH